MKIKKTVAIFSKISFLPLALIVIFSADSASAMWSTANLTSTGLPTGSIYGIIMGIMNWILVIFGFVGVIGFIIAGIIYLTSAGDETMTKKAKSAMMASIIGVIVGLGGLVIIRAADSMLRGTPGTLF